VCNEREIQRQVGGLARADDDFGFVVSMVFIERGCDAIAARLQVNEGKDALARRNGSFRSDAAADGFDQNRRIGFGGDGQRACRRRDFEPVPPEVVRVLPAPAAKSGRLAAPTRSCPNA
jgi:hypothetical protein